MKNERRPIRRLPVTFCLLPIAYCLSSILPSAAPFFRHRDATLTYPGPSEDLTNLTEIRIAWFGPTNLTDPLAGDLWWAANLAVQEANHANSQFGVRSADCQSPNPKSDLLPFRLLPCWTADPWGSGVSQLTRMIYEEQPLAVLGSIDSASTHLAEQIAAKTQLPLVSPIATDPSVTLAGVSWMFACAPSDTAIARLLVDHLLDTLNPTDGSGSTTSKSQISNPKSEIRNPKSQVPSAFALLAATDHESRMTTREVLKELSRRGRLPDFRFDLPPGNRELTAQLDTLTKTKPSAVLVVAGPEDAACWVRALRDPIPDVILFGSHSLSRHPFPQSAGPAAEGVRFPLLFDPDAADPVAVQFVERHQAERRRPPDYAAALTYDATRLLIEAIRIAGPNRARIREALTQLSPWPGIAGPIQFDGTGQNTRSSLCVGTIRDGAIVPSPQSLRPGATTDRTTHR